MATPIKELAEHLRPISDDEADPAVEVKLMVPEGFDNSYEVSESDILKPRSLLFSLYHVRTLVEEPARE